MPEGLPSRGAALPHRKGKVKCPECSYTAEVYEDRPESLVVIEHYGGGKNHTVYAHSNPSYVPPEDEGI